jgi:LVIVD repeat
MITVVRKALFLSFFTLACAHSSATRPSDAPAPSPDARIGLKPGLWDAGQAVWNLNLVSTTRPTPKFADEMNSDMAFTGHFVIQGNFNGFQIWDITDPSHPALRTAYYCPASQSDVSIYKNLLIVSGEGLNGRLDCGGQGVSDTSSKDRLRGIRIFDISDMDHPKNVGNVQTCRGSHTHTLLVDPNDHDNVYVYISGSAGLRPSSELTGCVRTTPDKDPNAPLFRVEVIKIPLAHPEQAAVVSSGRIFEDLAAVKEHGQTPADLAEVAAAKAKGDFTADVPGMGEMIIPAMFTKPKLDSIAKARGGTSINSADSAALRAAIPGIIAKMMSDDPGKNAKGYSVMRQCHDITVFPATGLAGGACEGYGMLLDISNPTQPMRLDAVADTNFAYWHSATFNNDGTKLLFSDEWGGGLAPKCRKTDPLNWGADAIFAVEGHKLVFKSYYKMPAPQTAHENCVAHNGSMIPIPGRDVMVQAWYQGGVSVFDFTDASHPKEIAYFDRGPIDSTRIVAGGSWSAYWYNGHIFSSEIARGLDIFELTPNGLLTQNEIDAAKTVQFAELNVQGQPKFVWPPSFALARAYLDQLARSNGLPASRLSAVRQALSNAEKASGASRRDALNALATELDADAGKSSDAGKVKKLQNTVRDLVSGTMAMR